MPELPAANTRATEAYYVQVGAVVLTAADLYDWLASLPAELPSDARGAREEPARTCDAALLPGKVGPFEVALHRGAALGVQLRPVGRPRLAGPPTRPVAKAKDLCCSALIRRVFKGRGMVRLPGTKLAEGDEVDLQ
jgi:hypothetical protein